MNRLTTSVVIVGGGSAGWITAGTLAARFRAEFKRDVSVTLVESPNVPIVGVGEGTWPTMRKTLMKMGIRETDFIRECNVSFKQGAKFAKWATGEEDDYYYHPLMLPQGYMEENLVPHWLENNGGMSFSKAVCPQEVLCENGLAPKLITTPEYAGIANYAYHLDAGAFSEFLKNHCTQELGVRHVLDDVTGVNSAENGDISSVQTKESGDISGELFIDCTGFKSLLLGEHFNVPFKSCKDVLFLDTALAIQVPYQDEDSPIASHTISTAQDAGWIWDIGLPTRRGVGHVYSSAHTTQEIAEEKLRDYLSASVKDVAELEFRKIPINPGHREKFWEKNCVAIGLAAGFLEPLEASALLLVEISANFIAEQFPVNRSAMSVISKRFNETFLYRWDRIIDFLKLHYVASSRTDSAFWIDNRDPRSIPDSLQELLVLWENQSPWHDDFDRALEVFPAASYQYVLYGMGFKTDDLGMGVSDPRREFAYSQFSRNLNMSEDLKQKLPKNRDLIRKINKYGLQKV
ncbi:tryptophan halogenase family protein [Hirschia litorea]|uniref:Tryptophan halogenase family protein n=1 Tax=Hirschia litorea TaxID=1199156 RepID=A0ABW2IP82_9PROT